MAKPKVHVSVSGGRTSAYMAKLMLDHKKDEYDMRFVFANTGSEDEDTLRFVNDVDKHFGLNLMWVEAVVHPGRKACTHQIVNYETASRNNEPYEAMCAKYGLPNQTFKHCTRELKLNPMRSYLRSIGWRDYIAAVGIRTDEPKRLEGAAKRKNLIYPLAHEWPTDKQDVLDFWAQYAWDLKIPEHFGNCVTCFKKSDGKLNQVYRERPDAFQFPIRLDDLYRDVGKNNVPGPRRMFRQFRDPRTLIAQFEQNDFDASRMIEDGGCSESCEAYLF